MSIKYPLFIFICLLLFSCAPNEEEKIQQAKSLMQSEEWDKALVQLEEAIAYNDQNPTTFNLRGIIKLEQGLTAAAIADFDRSVALDSSDYRTVYNRGNAHYQMEEYSKAIDDFDAAIRLQPKAADIYINRGNTLVNLQQYTRAVLDYSFALKLDEDNYLTHFNLGRAYFLMDSLELAGNSFAQSVQIYSTFAPAYYFLGMIAMENDQPDAACLHLQQAADLGYQQAEEAKKLYCEAN
ncbi:MAG: tetratricopeptide repeat protein [Cyclobacteriaceae bacterium]|nr:tetratricopeptide repeat protein [Cyclobacteriaceae bacterium]